jgi:Flp pilus assembly protein TadG
MNPFIRNTFVRRLRRSAADESGQALVEFGLILPLLMVAIVMVLDFGKAFHHWQDENHVANRAARLAAVNSLPTGCGGSLQTCVQQEIDTPELKNGGTDSVASPAKVCIDFPGGGATVGQPVRVTVSATYRWMPILRRVAPGIGVSTLKGSATMRIERPATNYSAGCSS